MLTKVIPVTTTWTIEENLPFDKVFHIRYGRTGFKEYSDSQNFSYKKLVRVNSQVSYEPSASESAASIQGEDIKGALRGKISEGQN
jgi:hypothetical protein